MKKILSIVVLFFLSVSVAPAATVYFSPASFSATTGQGFSLDILGDFTSGEAIEGGGLNLVFDRLVVNVTNVAVNTTLFDFFSDPGTINNSTGAVTGIVFNTFAGASGTFRIATIDFTAMGLGSTALILTESSLNPFSSAVAMGSLTVGFQSGSVSVTAVPVPAAAWLLASGLGVFGGFLRKRRAA